MPPKKKSKNMTWSLPGELRQITISSYKDDVYVHLNDAFKKYKGISMCSEEFDALLNLGPEIKRQMQTIMPVPNSSNLPPWWTSATSWAGWTPPPPTAWSVPPPPPPPSASWTQGTAPPPPPASWTQGASWIPPPPTAPAVTPPAQPDYNYYNYNSNED
jgi:hypothetical protein